MNYDLAHEVERILDTNVLGYAFDFEATPDRVTVTLAAKATPETTRRILTQVALVLAGRGYHCERSRTRVTVTREARAAE